MEEEKKGNTLRQIFAKGITSFLVVISSISFAFILFKIEDIGQLIKTIFGIIQPIVIGLALAYVINPLIVYLEKRLKIAFKNFENKKVFFGLTRGLSIFIVFLFLIIFIYILGKIVVPELMTNIMNVVNAVPGQTRIAIEYLNQKMSENTELAAIVDRTMNEAVSYLTNWLKNDMPEQISTIISGVVGVAGTLLDIIIGLIITVYVLMSKETFNRQAKKVIYAIFNKEHSEIIINTAIHSDRIFGGFISGKIIDSLIIGVLCFIGLTILKMPYTALVSVIVGITNVIPFFGPYVGAVPSAILILLADPSKGIIFIIFILVLQQVDGNIIGPKILGESTGLSPFWVIFSILFGGGLFGVVGMIIGVPTFAVIYYVIKTLINYKLKVKGIYNIENLQQDYEDVVYEQKEENEEENKK